MGRVEDRGRHDHCLQPRNLRIPSATTALASPAPTRSGPRPAAGAVVAPEWPGANPAGTGTLDGVQRVHPLPLVLALPAVRAGGAIRAPVALGATERANLRNPAGVGTETERPQRLAQLRRAQGVVAARVRCQQFLQQLYRWVREKL